MDHLPTPKDRHPLDVTVPYISADGPSYDRHGWQSFPSRQGYTAATGLITCHELSTWSRPEPEIQALFQSWMYFGLLDEVFGDIDTYRRDNFVTTSPNASTVLITTSQLFHYIVQKQMSLKLFQNRPLFGSRNEVEMDGYSEVTRIKALLDSASRQVNEWDWFALGRGKIWTTLVLSVRLLVEGLYYAIGESYQHLGVVDLSLTASVNYVRQHMLDNHWCTYQFDALCTKVSFTTLVYIANIKREPRDHRKCHAKGRCVAFDTDTSSFTSVKHTNETCSCTHISAPIDQLVEILNTGGIPVLSCTRNRSGQLVDIRYIKASPGLQYVAISHLWANGLGNPLSNSLPDCQLRQLLDHVQAATPEIARYGYFGMAVAGTEKAAVALRAISRTYGRLSRLWRATTTVNIWLDVYCIPVVSSIPTSTNAASSHITNFASPTTSNVSFSLTEAESKILKKAAIRRMDATYSWASYTLVLDRELSQITGEIDETEFLARLGISAWNSRCWTFQEHSLAQVAAYRCRNGVTFKHVPYGKEPEQMTYWSIAKPDLPVMLGLTEDLEGLALPSRIITGGTYWSPTRLEPQRSINPGIRTFVDAWNSFIGRNTTMSQDLLSIFANLLGLSASEILELETTDDQMKAILAAQNHLPLSLLFVETVRTPDSRQTPHNTLNALRSRWIPMPPFKSPLWDRCNGFHMTMLPDGLLLEPSILCGGSQVRMLRVELPSLSNSRWIFSLSVSVTNTSVVDHQFWLSLDHKQLKLCQRMVSDAKEVVVVLDSSSFLPHEPTTESFTGACLLPTSLDARGREMAIFVFPIRWGFEFPSRYEFGEQASQDAVAVDVEAIDGSHVDILITSGKFASTLRSRGAHYEVGLTYMPADIQTWPKLRLNRNKIQRGYTQKSMHTMLWLCVILAACFLLQILTGILLGPGYIGRMALAAALGLLPSLLLLIFVANIMNLAHKYTLLYSMQPDFDPSLKWWDKLDRAIVLVRTDGKYSRQMIQLNILLGVGRSTRIVHDTFEWVKVRLYRRRDQGPIALP